MAAYGSGECSRWSAHTLPDSLTKASSAKLRHPLVTVVMHWVVREGGAMVTALELSSPEAGASRHPCGPVGRYFDLVSAYLQGCPVDPGSIPHRTPTGTSFQTAVIAAARTVERGTVVSYGELAMRAGFPGAARGAATVMRMNPLALIIPCHRVVSANGKVGGYLGETSGWGVACKKALLHLEGYRFDTHRRHPE